MRPECFNLITLRARGREQKNVLLTRMSALDDTAGKASHPRPLRQLSSAVEASSSDVVGVAAPTLAAAKGGRLASFVWGICAPAVLAV